MTTINLLRSYYADCTTGRLRTDTGYQCLALELPWLGNEPNRSCIPEGDYPYRVAWSPNRKSDVIWLDNVPGRSAIQIHTGNYTSQILGCILPGMAITDLNNDGILDVSRSGDAFAGLMANIEKTGIIKIRAASAPYGVYKHD